MENNSRKKKNGWDLVLLLVIILLIFIIGFLAYKLGSYMIDETRSVILSRKLQESVLIMDTDDTESDLSDSVSDAEREEETEETEVKEQIIIPKAVDFESLYAMNKDTVAWMYDPGMVINYPVVQASDNDYYLRRNLNGERSNGGTLFVDYRNKADFSDWNTIIYGHNMKSGTMFSSLLDYRTPGYYEEHPEMYLYVPDKRYRVELILAYTTDVNDAIFQLTASREEQEAGLERAYRLSNFESNIRPDRDDKLVTFVTCSYAYDDARYVVIGRLVEE